MKQFGPKQPYEEYYLGFDFARPLDNETVATATFSAEDVSTGEDVTSALIDNAKQYSSGTIAYFWIRGGVSGVAYKITCRVVGSSGSKFEDEGRISVIEK
jgi:hypothetical protein